MKRLVILIISLFMMSCATTGLDKKVDDLDKRLTRIELMSMAGGATANFYPARDFTGGGASALDGIGSTNDGDVGFVVVEDHATYGNALFVYVLDATSACGGDDAAVPPKFFQAADGGNECWELTSTYALSSVSPLNPVSHSSGNDTLTAEEVMNTFLYVSVGGELELPDIGTATGQTPIGSSFCVFTVGAITIILDPSVNDSITLNGIEDTNGDKITNTSTAGDVICLIAAVTDGWVAPSNPDLWTAGGP